MYQIIDNDPERMAAWFGTKIGSNWEQTLVAAIGLERDGQLVAGTAYTCYLKQSISMHTCIEWMNRDFLWYCFYYPFIQLKVKKVLGLVDSFNTRAIKLDEHLGFQLEHSIKDAGTEGDLLIYSMTIDQCRWLNVARHLGVHNEYRRRQRR